MRCCQQSSSASGAGVLRGAACSARAPEAAMQSLTRCATPMSGRPGRATPAIWGSSSVICPTCQPCCVPSPAPRTQSRNGSSLGSHGFATIGPPLKIPVVLVVSVVPGLVSRARPDGPDPLRQLCPGSRRQARPRLPRHHDEPVVNEWYDHTLYSRLNDKRRGAIVSRTGSPKRRERWPRCRTSRPSLPPRASANGDR
jgi:hypothetical protein